MVLVQRGACNFTDKAIWVQRAEATAMVMYDNLPGCISMAAAEDGSSTLEEIKLLSVSISKVREGLSGRHISVFIALLFVLGACLQDQKIPWHVMM